MNTRAVKEYFLNKIQAVVLCLFAICLLAPAGHAGTDPVIEYYRSAAEAALLQDCPLASGAKFSCKTVSRYLRWEEKKMHLIDTAVVRHFFTGAHEDSIHVEQSSGKKALDFSLSCPDVFLTDYLFNLFPNDTGGNKIALGFDSPSVDDTLPVGVAILNRDTKRPISLYLYYPGKADYRRYSRTLHFNDTDSLIFPSSLVEIGVRDGLISSETFRIEIECSEVTLIK